MPSLISDKVDLMRFHTNVDWKVTQTDRMHFS